MHAGTEPLRTDRLILRRFALRDARSMLENWIGDEEVQSGYGEPAYERVESVEELLRSWIAAYSRLDFYRWAIILAETEECIGQIAFCSVDERHHFADLEYCIGRSHQKKGFAAEALRSVISYTFDHTGFNRLQAFHRGRNAASGQVLRKAGMRLEGIGKQSFYYPDTDEYDDRVYYGMTRDDYRSRESAGNEEGL